MLWIHLLIGNNQLNYGINTNQDYLYSSTKAIKYGIIYTIFNNSFLQSTTNILLIVLKLYSCRALIRVSMKNKKIKIIIIAFAFGNKQKKNLFLSTINYTTL